MTSTILVAGSNGNCSDAGNTCQSAAEANPRRAQWQVLEMCQLALSSKSYIFRKAIRLAKNFLGQSLDKRNSMEYTGSAPNIRSLSPHWTEK